MPRASDAERARELSFLAEWVRTIDEYIGSKSPDAELDRLARESTQRAIERRDLRGLRMAQRDGLETALGMNPRDQKELDRLLRARTGRGLQDLQRQERQGLAAIVKRGRVATDAEYRRLAMRAEQLFGEDTPAATAELEQINELLAEYRPGDDG